MNFDYNSMYTPENFMFGLNQPGMQAAQGGAMGQMGQGFFGNGRELGFNAPTVGAGLSGLATIGNIWNAFQSQKLAKQQFNYTKGVTETNLANSIAAYNTTLADRSRSRGAMEGQSQAEMDKYVNDNRAVRR